MRTEIDYSWLKRKVALVFSSFLSATIMKFELNSCPSRAATPANHVKENIEFLGNRKRKGHNFSALDHVLSTPMHTL